MVADSRGPAISRRGFRYSQQFPGNDVRIGLLNYGVNSVVSLIMTDLLLTVSGLLGPLPKNNNVSDPAFDQGGINWLLDASGPAANVTVGNGVAILNRGTDDLNGYASIAQQVSLSAAGNINVSVVTDGSSPYQIRIGDAAEGTEYYSAITTEVRHDAVVNIPVANPFITIYKAGEGQKISIDNVSMAVTTTQLEFSTPYPEEVLSELTFVEAPDGNSLYILHPNYPVHKLLNTSGVLSFGPVGFTAPPASWTGSNWPSAGAVFEGRLWLGGTPNQPQTFWGSQSGALENFTPGTNANDGLEFTLSRFGAIAWIVGTKNLLIGTVNGEHVISSEAGLITPTDVKVDQQSSYGSSRVQPVQVGDQVFYVSADGTKVRAMQYEWAADNWLSKDLTFFSEHITKARIREMTWAPNPDNLLVCTLQDGTMAWLSYERGENVWGWHRHDTDGQVKDSTAGVRNGFSFIIAGIQRDSGNVSIEVIAPDDSEYMDSWVERVDLAGPFSSVSGLDHLEGDTVQVLADGASHPDRVVAGGSITLQAPANTVVVGLKYTPQLVSLPLESGSPTGSSLAYLKRYNRLIVGLLDSALPLINGKRAPDRSPSTPMNTREPNKTGQVDAYQLGWSEGAVVTIEQDLPLALTVLYIGGELPQDVL